MGLDKPNNSYVPRLLDNFKSYNLSRFSPGYYRIGQKTRFDAL